MDSAKENQGGGVIIQTPEGVHQQTAQAVEGHLKQAGMEINPPVMPTNPHGPFPITEELRELGGEALGDLTHVAAVTAMENTVGTTYTRYGNGEKFMRFLVDRVRRKNPGQVTSRVDE